MPPSVKSWSLLVFAVAGAAAAPVLAAAGEARADPMADAKDLFTRGRELRMHGDCANAVAMFRKAYDLYPPALGSLRNLAECQESLGRYASARRAWVDLKRALLANADRKYEGWDRDAEQAAARLAPMLATLAIDVVAVTPRGEVASPDAIEVTLDGERLAPAQMGTPLERDPGRHVVRVAGERVSQPQERALDLASGNAERLSFRVVVRDLVEPGTLPPAASASPSPGADRADAAPPPQRHDTPRDTGSDGRRTWGWIALGVGAASVAGTGISLAVRQAALADLNGACQSHQGGFDCSPTLASTVSRGQTASTLVTVFAILGGVGLAGGIVLLATSGGHSSVTSLVVVPGGGGVSAAGSF
jgi:Tetratricopeptide repeat